MEINFGVTFNLIAVRRSLVKLTEVFKMSSKYSQQIIIYHFIHLSCEMVVDNCN